MHNQVKVTHLTSVHPRYDTRIFIKMCSSLAKNGYEVSLVVADGDGNESKNRVSILDVGTRHGGRLARMSKTVAKVFDQAKKLDSDIYHFHDPELIPIGIKLKKLGKIVIFDAHEDLPKQILGKPYLNRWVRAVLSSSLELYEKYSCGKFDAVIAATPFIRDKFLKINKNTVDINNFPILEELASDVDWEQKMDQIAYVGGLWGTRGVREIVKAIEYVDNVRLNIVGKFSEPELESEVEGYNGWSRVNNYGFLGRSEVARILSFSKAGLVVFHPLPNHVDSQPNKMFEYMSAGLPVISSNFPLWKEIVEGNQCGLCVDPHKPEAIAAAIKYLISNPQEAQVMGRNGRKAVIKRYNWAVEEAKLLGLYQKLKNEKLL